MIITKGLIKEFANPKPFVALDNVELDIGGEEKVAIVGPSGCGKTTLLRLLCGLEKPSAGEIYVKGGSPEYHMKQRGIGFVFQYPVLFPWRKVRENVMLATEVGIGRSASESKSERKARADELIDVVGLKEFADAYPGELSGGMQQRAAVARALMRNPGIMLFDEPFSALDEVTRERLWIEMSGLWSARKLTVCLVTHSVREAVFLSDKVYVLSPRPGTVLFQIKINQEHPREEKFLWSKEYYDYCSRVRESSGNSD